MPASKIFRFFQLLILISSLSLSGLSSAGRAAAQGKMFSGAFDDARAMEVIFGNYDAEKKQSRLHLSGNEVKESNLNVEEGTKELDVFAEAFFSKDFRQAGNDRRFLLMRVAPPDYECHVCSPAVAGATFTKTDAGWRLDAFTKFIVTTGSYGAPPEGELVRMGPDRTGVLMTSAYEGQGITEGGFLLIAENAGKLSMALAVPGAFGDNSGDCGEGLGPCYEFKSATAFVPGANPDWYDFTVSTEGAQKNDKGRIVPAKKKQRFTFRDGKYQAAK